MNYVLLPPGFSLTRILNQTSTCCHSAFLDHFGCLSSEGVVQHHVLEDPELFFSPWSAGFLVANAVIFIFGLGQRSPGLPSHVFRLSRVSQVCCDGLLLGPRSRRKTQVSAAGAMSNWISCSVGSLRLKLRKKMQFTDWEKAWHTSAAPCITRTCTRDVYKATLKGESTSSKTLCLRML